MSSLSAHLLFVAFGGAAGGVARLAVTRFIDSRSGTTFPWGTLCVNASGALLIGVFGGALSVSLDTPETTGWLLLVVGLLGSYTTVSAFSLQTLGFLHHGERSAAVLYIMLSLVLCLGLVTTGWQLGLRLAAT